LLPRLASFAHPIYRRSERITVPKKIAEPDDEPSGCWCDSLVSPSDLAPLGVEQAGHIFRRATFCTKLAQLPAERLHLSLIAPA
jgi:hypothetical protein